MKKRLWCNLELRLPAGRRRGFAAIVVSMTLSLAFAARYAHASSGDAPAWMHALVNVPLPEHDEKTDAVLLYSEKTVTVLSADKIKTQVRVAYKILRPGGRELGDLFVPFRSDTKIVALHAWCIPAQGKDYEVKDKDAADVALPAVPGSELISDVRAKSLRIPASEPGNIVGWEYEQEEHPMVLQDGWYFQRQYPVREEHYSLQLPAGWEYKTFWLNHPEVAPVASGNNQWQWVVTAIPALKKEEEMPPARGIAGQMIVSIIPPGGGSNVFVTWRDMGGWYNGLTQGRRDATADITQKTTALTAGTTQTLAKMRAIAEFVQRDIRYVGIELGIGGFQPHSAADVFAHRYGDCKDKATLMSSMLKGVGVDSYYVIINTRRGAVTPDMPAHVSGFNHAVLAIKLPEGLNDPSLVAVMQDAKLGRILFFDPTDEYTPFGMLRGPLQANYGLLVTPEGGELTELPQLPGFTTGIQRTAKLTLSPGGTLAGDVEEVRVGDSATWQRHALKSVSRDLDRIKPIETMLARSLPTYRLTKASVMNLDRIDLPFAFNYSLVAENYAKSSGGLLLVRMRVMGIESSALLETKEARQYPVVFSGPVRNTDSVEMVMPAGYEVEDLPDPVSADYSFASYHSKTEVIGNVLHYNRTLEIKEPSVPLNKVNDLKMLYRIIAADEKNTAVLRPAATAAATAKQ
jgi:hypothetical protein